ncbi:hypothetical protein JTB14_024755 [Gonioctena quinquepunctata]|nr:hypothetical protein JTB14_024755 [Gonioctena quinquepunctata]
MPGGTWSINIHQVESKMKCLILFSVIAVCYSVPLSFGDRKVTIDDRGTITVTGTNGRKLVISKISDGHGSRNVRISAEDPSGFKQNLKIFHADQEKEYNNLDPIEQLLKKWKVENSAESESQSDESIENNIGRSHRGKSQADILAKIFEQHQGVVDDESFEEILDQVDENVRSGQLDNSIHKVLKAFGQNQQTSSREGSSEFISGGHSFDDEQDYQTKKSSFLKSNTQKEQRQKNGLNELRKAIFQEKPQVSLFLFKGVPFAYRYTDLLPKSGLNEELLQIMGDYQGNNLELVPLQQMLQDPEYQPALRQYLKGNNQATHSYSAQSQTIQKLLEKVRQSHQKNQQQQFNQQQKQVIRKVIPKIMQEMLKDDLQEWAQQNLEEDEQQQFQKLLQEGGRGASHEDDEEELNAEQQELIRQMVEENVQDQSDYSS